MCFPPGIIRIEKRRSDEHPVFVHYRSPNGAGVVIDEGAATVRSTPRPGSSRLRGYSEAPTPYPTAVEVGVHGDSLLTGLALGCGLKIGWNGVDIHCNQRHLCFDCEAARRRHDLAQQGSTAPRKNGFGWLSRLKARKGVPIAPPASGREDTNLSLLQDLLRKVVELIGLESDRDHEIDRLKQQLRERRQRHPGHIPPMAGWPHAEGSAHRRSTDTPMSPRHRSRRNSHSSNHQGCTSVPNAPSCTPAHWQYPYGCQVPSMAILEHKQSRRRHRKKISEHNAKYKHGEEVSGGVPRSSNSRSQSSGKSSDDTACRSTSIDTTLNSNSNNDGNNANQPERPEEPKHPEPPSVQPCELLATVAVIKAGVAEEKIIQLQEEQLKRDQAASATEKKVKAMEERIKQAPELIAGLGIFMDVVDEQEARAKERFASTEQAMKTLDERLTEMGQIYGDLETRLNAGLKGCNSQVGSIGTLAIKRKMDMKVIKMDLHTSKTFEEKYEDMRRKYRRQKEEAKSPWSDGQKSWYSSI